MSLFGKSTLWVLAVLLSGSTRLVPPADTPRKPNIVLIMADDLGYEALGCYGGTSYRTPNLDRLAQTGIRFRHAYAQPLCTSTRVQLMTGKYNHRNWIAFGILDPKERTVGHFMRQAGYATCIVGKWQLQSYDPPDYPGAQARRGIGMHPKDAGFDEFCLWHTGHTEDKGSRYADLIVLENGKFRQDTQGKYGPDVFADYVCDFMERHRKQPFFAYFPMALTHGPFVPTPESKQWADKGRRHKSDPGYFKDMVEYMDKVVAQIVRKVDQLGIREDTLILFFSDNGSPRNISSRVRGQVVQGGKGLTTDAGTRVPLIANWKGTTPVGMVTDDLVDSTDFLPTILEAAASRLPENLTVDGQSFLPQLRGQKGNPREWVFFHFDPRPGWGKDRYTLHRFTRNGRFKLYSDGRLFDVPGDLLEQRPIMPGDDTAVSARERRKLKRVLDAMR